MAGMGGGLRLMHGLSGICATASAVLFSITATLHAEPAGCIPENCGEAPVSVKVQFSFERALHVVVAQLESISAGPTVLGHRVVTFKVERQFKGSLPKGPLQLLLDPYEVPAGDSSAQASKPVSPSDFEMLESNAELAGTEEAKKTYWEKLKVLRERLKKYGADESQPVFVLPIQITAFDDMLRTTDVPLRSGHRYALFIFEPSLIAPDKPPPQTRATSGPSMPLDLYSLEGERGKQVRLALRQSESSQKAK
jgi:hypothetical protein